MREFCEIIQTFLTLNLRKHDLREDLQGKKHIFTVDFAPKIESVKINLGRG